MSSEKHIMKRKKVPFLSFGLLGIDVYKRQEVEIREYERTVNQSILDQNERIKSKQKRRGERV